MLSVAAGLHLPSVLAGLAEAEAEAEARRAEAGEAGAPPTAAAPALGQHGAHGAAAAEPASLRLWLEHAADAARSQRSPCVAGRGATATAEQAAAVRAISLGALHGAIGAILECAAGRTPVGLTASAAELLGNLERTSLSAALRGALTLALSGESGGECAGSELAEAAAANGAEEREAELGGTRDERTLELLLALGGAHRYSAEALLSWFVSWARSQPQASEMLVRRSLIAAAAEHVQRQAGAGGSTGADGLAHLVQAL